MAARLPTRPRRLVPHQRPRRSPRPIAHFLRSRRPHRQNPRRTRQPRRRRIGPRPRRHAPSRRRRHRLPSPAPRRFPHPLHRSLRRRCPRMDHRRQRRTPTIRRHPRNPRQLPPPTLTPRQNPPRPPEVVRLPDGASQTRNFSRVPRNAPSAMPRTQPHRRPAIHAPEPPERQ